MDHTITVHDFCSVGSVSLRWEQGRDLALACSNSHRWVTPKLTTDMSVFTLRHDRLYVYRVAPPSVTAARRPTSIPEWDTPSHAEDPDHYRLHDLEEFQSTDLHAYLTRPRMKEAGPSRLAKRIQPNDSCVKQPVKRPRVENNSIRDLIPQPHFIRHPAVRFQPVDTSKIPHYQKTLPSPIAPYDAAAVNELLRGEFRRGAWLIPVRGSLPWDGASTAIILDDTQTASRSPSPCFPMPVAQSRVVTWTPSALNHLWAFLASIQHAKHLGPLCLSFHAASKDALSTINTVSEPVWESNRPYYPQHSTESALGPSDDFATDICKAQLEATDYIKVYHDAPYSLSLRNILDAYRYEPVGGEATGRSGANDRKIRILKGARLVFMDECSKAAFVM